MIKGYWIEILLFKYYKIFISLQNNKMMIYPICEKFIDDRFNSGDEYILEIQLGLKKDGFNRNVFIISYIPKDGNFYGITQDIEKNYSIEKVLGKYGFNINDDKIKKRIKNLIDYRKGKLLYL